MGELVNFPENEPATPLYCLGCGRCRSPERLERDVSACDCGSNVWTSWDSRPSWPIFTTSGFARTASGISVSIDPRSVEDARAGTAATPSSWNLALPGLLAFSLLELALAAYGAYRLIGG